MTLVASQATIDLELGERYGFTFSPGCRRSLQELTDQKVRVALVPSMAGIDGKDSHCFVMLTGHF
jgi:hypothetical protein